MTKINLQEPECNRTGTGNIFNLIMRMLVRIVSRNVRANRWLKNRSQLSVE